MADGRSRRGFFLHQPDPCRQAAAIEHAHQLVDFLLAEGTGDFGIVVDRAHDQGRGEKLAVQNDAELVVEIGRFVGQVAAGQFAEQAAALRC